MKLKTIIKELDNDKNMFIIFFTIMLSLVIMDFLEIHIPAITVFIVLFSFIISYMVIRSIMKILMDKIGD